MAWWDWVFSVGGVIFILALLPTIFGPNKPAWKTALFTSTILFIYAFTYFSLELERSAIIIALLASCWAVIAVQSFREQR